MAANPEAIKVAARAMYVANRGGEDAGARWDAGLVSAEMRRQFTNEVTAVFAAMEQAGFTIQQGTAALRRTA